MKVTIKKSQLKQVLGKYMIIERAGRQPWKGTDYSKIPTPRRDAAVDIKNKPILYDAQKVMYQANKMLEKGMLRDSIQKLKQAEGLIQQYMRSLK